MATKEEYIKALNGMEEVYDNLDGCMSAMNMFKEGVNLLTGLINEHFEEKSETNYEHYEDEIIENSGFQFSLVDGKPNQCNGVSCCNCGFSTGHGCREKIEEWLKSPYKKPVYKLTKFEKELLQCYSDIYSFKVFNSLNGMKEKGYFKGIDDNEIIGDILGNCEVIK
jgi:hypothetical protein